MLSLKEINELIRDGQLAIVFEEENGEPIFNMRAENEGILESIDTDLLGQALVFATYLGFRDPKIMDSIFKDFIHLKG